MEDYVILKKRKELPRIPFEGSIDITYRCNNNCRHCWVNIPPNSQKKKEELNFDEIKKIVIEARSMGCKNWFISGGEPMLRPDFDKIFDLITERSVNYTLNTNGTLITPEIAKLMKRKGRKMISIYGADEKINDHITRVPGSFKAAMRGISYLKEASAGFIIQIVPMKDNFHQLKDMIKLAESLSPHWRYGASWLYLSSGENKEKDREIISQRLTPGQVLEIEPPSFYESEDLGENDTGLCSSGKNSSGILSNCINEGSSFHIDPYGGMSFCQFIKDPVLRINLKKTNFKKAWEEMLPHQSEDLALKYKEWGKGKLGKETEDNPWCPVYSYLENQDYYSDVQYLSEIEDHKNKEKIRLKSEHTRFFRIGGITIRYESDLPMNKNTFEKRFHKFEVEGPGKENILIRNHFFIPDLDKQDIGEEIFRLPPWAVYKKKDSYIYISINTGEYKIAPPQIGIFKNNHSENIIYNNDKRAELFRNGNFPVLSLSPSDQLLLAQVFAQKEACYFHSSGIIYKNSGYLFMGHSGAGKSTITTYLSKEVEILCDDRNIIRRTEEGFKVYGTWSHGDLPEVSPNSAPLKSIFFLVKSEDNRIEKISDKKTIISRLLAFIIKPLQISDWWERSLDLTEKIVEEVPCYFLHFRRDGDVKNILKEL